MSQDIVKIWMVKFGQPPVIHQTCQGFPLPKKLCYVVFPVFRPHVQQKQIGRQEVIIDYLLCQLMYQCKV